MMPHATILALLATLLPVPSAAAGTASTEGIWRNPYGTVDVHIQACGDEICGTIVRASAEADADAREAGVANLVGVELLRSYRRVHQGRWEGTVFVPDIGRSFASHIEQLSPTELKISGCLLGHWLCKSQLWKRA